MCNSDAGSDPKRFARGKFGSFASAHEGFAVILEERDELKAEVWKNQARGDGCPLPQPVPGLAKGQFPAIPRTDADLTPDSHIQAIANTAGFHKQGGNSLYSSMGVVKFLTAMGLFIGQPNAFLELLQDLATEADAAKRGGGD
jgi:hypothetical protein